MDKNPPRTETKAAQVARPGAAPLFGPVFGVRFPSPLWRSGPPVFVTSKRPKPVKKSTEF